MPATTSFILFLFNVFFTNYLVRRSTICNTSFKTFLNWYIYHLVEGITFNVDKGKRTILSALTWLMIFLWEVLLEEKKMKSFVWKKIELSGCKSIVISNLSLYLILLIIDYQKAKSNIIIIKRFICIIQFISM